jgi:hypothetical protein
MGRRLPRKPRRGMMIPSPDSPEAAWIEFEFVVILCIVDGFDFEDSKALVCPRLLCAGGGLVTFAYADLMIGNRRRRTGTPAASRKRDRPSDKHWNRQKTLS